MTASVRRRFAFTVAASLFRSLLSFSTGMLLARWLGPQSFGEMAFLLGTFVALRQFLDMGSATAFFTFMSQRLRSRRFVNAFAAWLGMQFLIPLCVIGLLFPARWIESIWHGEQRALVLLAFAAAYMQNSLWPVVQQAGEAQRQTIRVQGVGVAIVAVHRLAVVFLWFFGKLGLYAILAAVALEHLVAAALVRRSLSYADSDERDCGSGVAQSLSRQYLGYCLPLVPYAWVGFAYEFTDRWLLQRYGGSVQQAYYAVSAQFAAVALIATSSILSIFWKEIAEAHHRGDHARTGMLYQKVSRLLFLIGAVIAGYLVPWAQDVLGLLLGAAYAGGAFTLAVMFLYPIHQSMGQIGNAMLYATERVSVQVGMGIVFMLVSMGVTYLMLAPPDAPVPGFGLASAGLALKMVILQLIYVNAVAYVISRIWKWPFDWTYQPISLLGCVGLGWLAHGAAMLFSSSAWPLPVIMTLGGVLYLMLVALLVYALPQLTGFTRGRLVADAGMLFRQTVAGFKPK
jgi:O-antigen/teichoic acid export membrane protein